VFRASRESTHIRLLDDYAGLSVLQRRHAALLPPNGGDRDLQVYDAEATKNQLRHTSKTVTERHYINRKLMVPDLPCGHSG
jgi:hypothetical protein